MKIKNLLSPLVALAFLTLLFTQSCKDIPETEDYQLHSIGDPCRIFESDEIDFVMNEDWYFFNEMAVAAGFKPLDVNNGKVVITELATLFEKTPEIHLAIEDLVARKEVPRNLLENMELEDLESRIKRDRCCTVACQCGTIGFFQFTIKNVRKLKGRLTCEYFGDLAGSTYDQLQQLVQENGDDLPEDIVNLIDLIEGFWVPGENCVTSISTSACN